MFYLLYRQLKLDVELGGVHKLQYLQPLDIKYLENTNEK